MNAREAATHEAEIDRCLAALDLDRAESLAARYLRLAADEAIGAEPAHSPRLRAHYLAAQVSLAAGRLNETIARIGPVLPLADRLPPELGCRVVLLAAEAYARGSKPSEARLGLDRIQRHAHLIQQQPILHLRALRIRLWLGEVAGLARELARCARSLEGDPANLALLHVEEGRAWEAAGDLTRAQACLERADRLGGPAGPDPVRADVALQLGRLDHLQGRLPASLSRYDQALGLATAAPQRLEIQLRRLLVLFDISPREALKSAAKPLLERLRAKAFPEELSPLAAMVGSLLDGTPSPDASAEARAYQEAARGNTDAARDLYHAALADAPSPQRRARLAAALGLLALAHANRQEAVTWLAQAEGLAREHDLPEVLGRALQGRGQLAATLDGDEAGARRWFEQAVVVFEVQAGLFAHGADAAAYRQRHSTVFRYLARAAFQKGNAAEAFAYQELDRGRFLLDLWRSGTSPSHREGWIAHAPLDEIDRRLRACEEQLLAASATAARDPPVDLLQSREELRLQRTRILEQFLRDRSRRGTSMLPALPALDDLRRALPEGALYVAPTFVEDDLYLLAASHRGPVQLIHQAAAGRATGESLAHWRGCLAVQLARYARGLPVGRRERRELDERLEDLGRSPLGEAVFQALDSSDAPVRRIYWVPDTSLHALPLHALRREGRYVIEDREVVHHFGGALLVHQARTGRQRRSRFSPALVVAEGPDVLPEAAAEGEGVAATFWRSRTLCGKDASRAAVRAGLARARAAHFACHAHFEEGDPLAACVQLPSGERLYTSEWLEEPVAGLPLVTLSACRSAAVEPLVGREVFGPVTGLLGAGVRAVVAGLWPVADRETKPLMWRFYRQRLTHDLAGALAAAQRQTLAETDSSPIFWAPFVLYGDAAGVPAPCRCWRWLARWRQRRHARRFPVGP